MQMGDEECCCGEARGVGQRLASRSLYAMIVVLDAHV